MFNLSKGGQWQIPGPVFSKWAVDPNISELHPFGCPVHVTVHTKDSAWTWRAHGPRWSLRTISATCVLHWPHLKHHDGPRDNEIFCSGYKFMHYNRVLSKTSLIGPLRCNFPKLSFWFSRPDEQGRQRRTERAWWGADVINECCFQSALVFPVKVSSVMCGLNVWLSLHRCICPQSSDNIVSIRVSSKASSTTDIFRSF